MLVPLSDAVAEKSAVTLPVAMACGEPDPVAVPLALFLWLPGVILVAERVYALISRNRQWISRVFGCTGACALVPDRKPQG